MGKWQVEREWCRPRLVPCGARQEGETEHKASPVPPPRPPNENPTRTRQRKAGLSAWNCFLVPSCAWGLGCWSLLVQVLSRFFLSCTRNWWSKVQHGARLIVHQSYESSPSCSGSLSARLSPYTASFFLDFPLAHTCSPQHASILPRLKTKLVLEGK